MIISNKISYQSPCSPLQITEMKAMIGNLKTNLIEKEGKLDAYETLMRQLKREQDELHSELDQQKTKNNVRHHF